VSWTQFLLMSWTQFLLVSWTQFLLMSWTQFLLMSWTQFHAPCSQLQCFTDDQAMAVQIQTFQVPARAAQLVGKPCLVAEPA